MDKIEEYNEERLRLIREENMDYVVASNQAWNKIMSDDEDD
jgi:hypothetical protein